MTSLRTTEHIVESVHTLKLDGLDNGRLYRFAVENFDLCFTRDFGFIHNAKQTQAPTRFKLLRVVLPQKSQDEFVSDFMTAFSKSDFGDYQHGNDWP